ncbi:MAG: SPFH domain-containing protein [Eubacteriales bacterium]|nr:SPFH domain-containing protein [Eubacteriales bacterium]
MERTQSHLEEKDLHPIPGMAGLLLCILGLLLGVLFIVAGAVLFRRGLPLALSIILACLLILASSIGFAGLKVINPNEALVLALFGTYYGTLKHAGFFWVNPFCSGINPAAKVTGHTTAAASGSININLGESSLSKKVSLKTMTLNNEKQKVNDQLGNPIEIGTVVIWQVVNATKAVLNVENYKTYLSIQCDAITRNTARRYPYDTSEDDEQTLRSSTQEVADIMKRELQAKVEDAGILVKEIRITRLAYAPEIASAMLQRQQAAAIIDARQKIVEGAVSMVDMALQKLSENDIVELDEERKAAMVSNLLVVLCGNKDAQPIVNSGSLY